MYLCFRQWKCRTISHQIQLFKSLLHYYCCNNMFIYTIDIREKNMKYEYFLLKDIPFHTLTEKFESNKSTIYCLFEKNREYQRIDKLLPFHEESIDFFRMSYKKMFPERTITGKEYLLNILHENNIAFCRDRSQEQKSGKPLHWNTQYFMREYGKNSRTSKSPLSAYYSLLSPERTLKIRSEKD